MKSSRLAAPTSSSKEKGTESATLVSTFHVPISSVKPKDSQRPSRWEAPCVSKVAMGRACIGLRLMRSERWMPPVSTKIRNRGIPYILPSGHISGSSLATWKCSSAQWFATLCRSVWKRLSKRNNKKSIKKKLSKDMVTRIAILYSISQNDGDLDRLWYCNTRNVRGLLHHKLCKLDDQKRFLYDQMLHSISWLQSRGSPRAKSSCTENSTIVVHLDSGRRWRFITEYLNFLCDPWIVGKLMIR